MLAPSQQVIQATQEAAFIGGVNAAESLANMQPGEMVFCENMDISPEGLTTRKGFEEWSDGSMLGIGGVKTIIPYNSPDESYASSKLFAITTNGIYDVTTEGAAPSAVAGFWSSDPAGGFITWANWTNDAGRQYILAADGRNGFLIYDPTDESWHKAVTATSGNYAIWKDDGGSPGAPTVTGAPNADNIDFLMIWKSRLWIVEKNSGKAWYSNTNQFLGEYTQFNFANKFRYGGDMAGLYNWSLDGGQGMDDYLVAISRGGDVLVYQGTDPASDFGSVGSFWVGQVPAGHRVATDYGGDIYILSTLGIIPLSKLVAGAPSLSDIAITYKIQPLISQRMSETLDEFGWEIRFAPQSRSIIVNAARKSDGTGSVQFVYNTTLQAWTLWGVKNAITFETWGKNLFMGRSDGRLMRQNGGRDNVLRDASEPPNSIIWGFLGSFKTYGMPANYKKVELMRAHVLSSAPPAYNLEARYDYDTTPIDVPGVTAPGFTTGSIWDTAIWDESFWDGLPGTNERVVGGIGLGRAIAVGMRGSSEDKVSIVGIDLMMTPGGLL